METETSAAALAGTAANGDLTFRVDGTRPPTRETVAALAAVCDLAEDRGATTRLVLTVSGSPTAPWIDELTVALVSKWERALRRLERLPAVTVALASGDCGGTAFEALLAADYRIVTSATRLIVPVRHGATWPGMALYRLAHESTPTAAVRRAALFGTPLSATDALAAHLVHEVTDDVSGALAAFEALTGDVAGTELAIRRQLLAEATSASFEDALGAHLAACDRMLRRAAEARTV
jgi:isomerase DpgB